MLRELADYEKLSHEVDFRDEDLHRHLFGPRPYAEVLIAEDESGAAGFALFYHDFSTFSARPGIYLEDLFVRPAHRGAGHGLALLAGIARIALERGCGRMKWSVLDWNELALGFYRSLGSEPMDDWTVHRLSGDALRALAAR